MSSENYKITINDLFEYSDDMLLGFDDSFERALEHEIEWNQKLIGILGARGVGKTTIMLKYMRKKYGTNPRKAMYISMDNLYFVNNSLLSFARDFYKTGGEHLFLDEVHKYTNWSQELKNIYDSVPKLKIVFSGSSILDILKGKADLSRRADVYHLEGLSFREYLEIETKRKFKAFDLEDILNNHVNIAGEICKHIRPYAYWNSYLEYGYYPYYLQSKERYSYRLLNAINLTIENDLIMCRSVDTAYINKLKRLLYIISVSTPFQPNIAKLSKVIEASRATITQYFEYLREAELVNLLKSDEKSLNLLSKPDKVYLNNVNLMYAISKKSMNEGNVRETFFFNQVAAKHKITTPLKGDFLVDNTYTFEVGGKNKNNTQLKGVKNAYLATDDLEVGSANKIPLYLFGFLR